ncbi:MAG: FolC bifunctional protein [Anaeromyxobacteraceae bacterium]|nr:FolC bifunctional protein [Anaeromyxobacteraceae bacterium]
MGPNDYLDTLRPLAMRFGLERMERALEALGRPDRDLAILHVAGTNGKGSTCAMSAQALRLAGHRVGLYTSPHLVRSDRLTYFEFATLVGLLHLARERVGAAVVEVGLGGRFDATSAVTPRVAAVARIGLDHMQFLGDRVDAIAREKAGIFKRGVPAVVARAQPPEAMAALRDEAERRGAPFHVAAASWDGPVALRGAHQQGNAALAAAALRLLDASGVRVGEEAIREGIASARWPGRMEEVGGVLLDGAHNPDGAAALAAALPVLHPSRPVELVFGVLSDKDHEGMLAALAPATRRIHLVAPDSPRAREPGSYLAAARRLGVGVDVHASLPEALACARHGARDGALVCVAGSLYLVGEARGLLAGEEM